MSNRIHAGGKTLEVPRALQFVGVNSPAALGGAVNDYSPGDANVLRIDNGGASRNVTGLTGGYAGRILVVIAIGAANNVVLKHDDAGSVAANRFYGPNSADVTIRPNGSVTLMYDAVSSRWRVIGSAA